MSSVCSWHIVGLSRSSGKVLGMPIACVEVQVIWRHVIFSYCRVEEEMDYSRGEEEMGHNNKHAADDGR